LDGLDFGILDPLAGHRSQADVACPACGPHRRTRTNRIRRVLRIWRLAEHCISYNCARCGLSGYATANGQAPTAHQIQAARASRAVHQAEHARHQRDKARWLWRKSCPAAGTIVEIYLASRGLTGPIPPLLRFLAPSKQEHHPAMIAPFGVPEEPEPGCLTIDPNSIPGIHLTLLNPDGSGKADINPNKIMVGPSLGWPIVLAPPGDANAIAITEGIEEGLTLHAITHCGAWAAGCASRLPALADTVPAYIDHVTICADTDNDGWRNAAELAAHLRARGIHAAIVPAPRRR